MEPTGLREQEWIMGRWTCHPVTAQQARVLQHLLAGESVTEVALGLAISVSTARMHVRHLHGETGTTNLHSLVLWALLHLECCAWPRAQAA